MKPDSKNPKKYQLTANQLKAVDLLVSGVSASAVAKKIGVHPSTISVWKIQPEFEACMNVLLREARDDCREKLRSLGHEALETIQTVMKDTNTPPKERLSAALKVVEMLKIKEAAASRIGQPQSDPEMDFLNEISGPGTNDEKLLDELDKYLKGIGEEINSIT